MLGQVVTNLLTNALKFSPPHGHVTLTAAASDGLARLEVADEGPGIPTATGLLAGGGGGAALATAGAPAAASTTAVVASTPEAGAYGPLGSLVAKGTITEAQATTIHNALNSYVRDHWQDMRGRCDGGTPAVLAKEGALDAVLGQLVKDKTISQAQASAVTSAFSQWVRGDGPHGRGQHGDGADMMGGPGGWMVHGHS